MIYLCNFMGDLLYAGLRYVFIYDVDVNSKFNERRFLSKNSGQCSSVDDGNFNLLVKPVAALVKCDFYE